MALCADDMQATGSHDLVMFLAATFTDFLGPGFAFGCGQFLRQGCDHHVRIATQHDIGTTTGHVRGNRDRILAPGLGHDFRLSFVMFGVQYFVFDALLVEHRGQILGFFDRCRTDENRRATLMRTDNIADDRLVFVFRVTIDDIRQIFTDHRLVGRDDDDFQLVDLLEFLGLGIGRAGHAGQLFIQAEIVLECDRSQCLVFRLHFHAFLGFDGLMLSVGITTAGHHAAGEFIDDDDFATTNDVIDFPRKQGVGPERLGDRMHDVDVFDIVKVAGGQQTCFAAQRLDMLHALFGEGDGFVLFILLVIGFVQLFDQAISLFVQIGRLFRRAGNDQRRTRFVDEDGIYLIDNGEVIFALYQVFTAEGHVIAQVIEAEFVIGAVGDIGGVGAAPLIVVDAVYDDAGRQAEELIQLAHPCRITRGQIVIDGDHMHATSGQRIQIDRQGSHQRFTFTGFHFRNLALMQDHAADELHVVMAHTEYAFRCLATNSKGFRQQVIQRFALFQALFEFAGFGL